MRDWCLYWDGYGLDAPNSGIFVHARNLASALGELGIKPILVGNDRSRDLFADLQSLSPVLRASERFVARRSKLGWSSGVGRAIVRHQHGKSGRVLVHGLSNFNIPRSTPAHWRRILTIHDLIPFLAPKLVSRALLWQLRWLLPKAIAQADRIICVSEWTRQTLLRWKPECAEKVVVIPNGVAGPNVARRHARMSMFGGRIELLFVGRFEPYKGHHWLVEWLQQTSLPLRLTVITDERGRAFWQRHAPKLLGEGKVKLLGNVFGDQLRDAYESADIYVSPSQFEGFCLPAVEALAAGTPVVYRAGSGIDEVAGSSVSVPVLDHESVDAWDHAVNEALLKLNRNDFDDMVGAHLASLPTWKDAANRLVNLYNELV